MITKLQLQARHSSAEEWGTLTTVRVDASTDPQRAYKEAQKEVARQQSNWTENYDPTLQFRVVEL